MERTLTEQMRVEEREAKHRKQQIKVMKERIREKQAQVERLESVLNSLNISRSPVHMEFIHSPLVSRHRSGRREEEGGMGGGFGQAANEGGEGCSWVLWPGWRSSCWPE
jgi:hypothetical protein